MKWPAILTLVACCLAIDVASKVWAERNLANDVHQLLSFLSLRLGFNSGVAFSLFASDDGATRHYITAATSMMCVGIAYLISNAQAALERLSLALVLGGALGNIVDRIPDGFVTDFISVQIGSWHFPTFNFADAFISVGVVLFVIATLPGRGLRHGN